MIRSAICSKSSNDLGDNADRMTLKRTPIWALPPRDGLTEEAISEFQRSQTPAKGRGFQYVAMLPPLALAFMDKGQPAIAVNWYQRALQVPDLGSETVWLSGQIWVFPGEGGDRSCSKSHVSLRIEHITATWQTGSQHWERRGSVFPRFRTTASMSPSLRRDAAWSAPFC
jgi:hypothetical protein